MSVPPWLATLVAAVRDADGPFPLLPDLGVPAPPTARRSAVLALFGEGPHGPDVLLIERAAHLRSHAGQPAFPGGGIDPGDDGPVAAALREAAEETGLDPAGVDVLAVLADLWLPPSGNVVTPVVAWWREPSQVHPADPDEVAAVARVPVAELADPDNRLQIRAPNGRLTPAFAVAGMVVWGFTAGLLDRLLAVGGWERDWDRSRVGELSPERLEQAMRSRRFAAPMAATTED